MYHLSPKNRVSQRATLTVRSDPDGPSLMGLVKTSWSFRQIANDRPGVSVAWSHTAEGKDPKSSGCYGRVLRVVVLSDRPDAILADAWSALLGAAYAFEDTDPHRVRVSHSHYPSTGCGPGDRP